VRPCPGGLSTELFGARFAPLSGLLLSPRKAGTPRTSESSTAMQPLVSSRIMVLLRGLHTRGFARLPPGAGRKSVNVAMFNGWVQVEDQSERPRCKLTPAGDAYRREHGYLKEPGEN